jgi:hypothetical protein
MPRDDIGIEKELDALNVAQGQSCPRDAVQHTHRPRGVLHRYRDAAAVRAVRERQLEGIDLPVIVPRRQPTRAYFRQRR